MGWAAKQLKKSLLGFQRHYMGRKPKKTGTGAKRRKYLANMHRGNRAYVTSQAKKYGYEPKHALKSYREGIMRDYDQKGRRS